MNVHALRNNEVAFLIIRYLAIIFQKYYFEMLVCSKVTNYISFLNCHGNKK